VSTSEVSIPPKPNAFVIAALTRALRPSTTTWDTLAHAGSISSSPAVGTSICRATTSAVMAASIAPAAARVCPSCPLELDTATPGAIARAIAAHSTESFDGVAVPWAFT